MSTVNVLNINIHVPPNANKSIINGNGRKRQDLKAEGRVQTVIMTLDCLSFKPLCGCAGSAGEASVATRVKYQWTMFGASADPEV